MVTIDPPLEQLTLAERYELLERIEETLPPVDPPFSEEHMALLQERLKAAEEGRNPSIDYDTAMAWLRSQCK
jgi:hypothetical protein